jgi:hypothetical protein
MAVTKARTLRIQKWRQDQELLKLVQNQVGTHKTVMVDTSKANEVIDDVLCIYKLIYFLIK